MEQRMPAFDMNNLRDILAVIFKHQYVVIATFAIIFLSVTIAAFTTKATYEAKSVLLVKFGREFAQRPDAGTATGFTIPTPSIMKGEISILTSRDLINRVIKEVGIQQLYPGLAQRPAAKIPAEQVALRLFEENLRVASASNSNLIEVSFSHSDPSVAAKVVNSLVAAFKDKHLEVFSGNNTEFLESQQKTFQTRLRESEGKLATFKESNRVFSFEEQKSALIQQRGGLDTNLKTAQNQISELEQKIAFIRSPRWIIDSPLEMRAQLATLQLRERELLDKYTEGSRAVQNVRHEIQILKDALKKNIEDSRQIELGRVEGELSVVKARSQSLRQQFGQVESEIRTLDGRGRELQDLKREAVQQEQSYQNYAKKLEESLIMDDMDQRKMVAISTIEKAVPSMLPQKTKLSKKQMLAAGLIGGVIAGIALAFLMEFMASGMTTPYSAERRLGLPVMVAITKKAG